MKLDFRTKGKVKMSMVPFLKNALEQFPEEIKGTALTPASDHLFTVKNDRNKRVLEEPLDQAFHHAVAQLLYVTMRCRRDIHTAVSFLCTRVKQPDYDNWLKLKRLLEYVKGTLHLELTLEATQMSFVKW
jgi:hypothetical protein